MRRRAFLGAAAAVAGGGCATTSPVAPPATRPGFAPERPIARIDARPERLIDVAVCTRPFRAAGPRIEAERLGTHTVIHHYGHGGSGWSLSWGSAAVAMDLVRSTQVDARDRRLAVIGCGAIGLTTAIVAQRAGYRVRIHASERPPEVRSSNATGVWSPDSRICTDAQAPAFADRWEAMARRSWWMHQRLLGLPGEPVEWRTLYAVSEVPFDQPAPSGTGDDEPDYPDLEGERTPEFRRRLVAVRDHPFAVPHVRRGSQLTFNLVAYARMLVDDFERAGGEIVTRTFASPREFRSLPERMVVNCTGYGARALMKDDSVVPVRGQNARLIPQPEVDYVLYYRGHNLSAVSRRDGILVQTGAPGDFGNADTRVDRAASEAAVSRLATLFA